MAGLLHKAALPDAGSLFQRRPARCWANERGLPPGNAAKKRPAFRSPTTPLEGGLRGHPAQAQGPGGGGEASELPHFLESSPVPRGPARRVLRGPGEPDNRRWLALKQSGNPLVSAGPPHRNREPPPASEDPRLWPRLSVPTRVE